MFWRRYAHGVRPLLIWARDDDAADVTAAIHTAFIPRPAVLDITPLLEDVIGLREMLDEIALGDPPTLQWDEDEMWPL